MEHCCNCRGSLYSVTFSSWAVEHLPVTGIKAVLLRIVEDCIDIPSNFSKSKSGTNHTFKLIMTIPTMNFIKITMNIVNYFFDDVAFLHLVSKQAEEAVKK